VRDVGKAMGLSEDTVAALAGMVWGTHSEGGAVPEAHVRGAGLDPGDPRLRLVLELTQELIGFPRHLSQHVGGFVLTRGPLVEVVPVGNAAMEDRTFIEWDKDDIAALGLLKVDVLALGMLSCIRRAFDFLAAAGTPVSLATVPREDPAVYDMLCRADSVGVFQVESRAQMNMLPRLKPRTFYDLVIEVAIVRPGPIQGDMVHPYLRRRDGLEPEDYPAPDPAHGPPDELRQILGKTKGVPLFQEQAMRIALVAAKFSETEVNELRKAMATFRRRGTIGLLEEKMVNAMVARGYDPEFAARCFNQIKGFGEYGFPESHAASFAHLVYVSAWIKCHYPAVFAAALLNSQPMGFYAPAQIVRCARDHGVEAREPDVNLSLWDCTLEPCSPLPACGGARASCGAEGGEPQTQNLLPTPLPALPHKGGGGANGAFDSHFALRLGLRQIDGLREADMQRLVSIREGISADLMPHLFAPPPQSIAASSPSPEKGEGSSPDFASGEAGGGHSSDRISYPYPHPPPCRGRESYSDVRELWRRSGLSRACLEKLAAADAFRSLGLDRRQGLWEVRGLPKEIPLPLFEHADAAEAGIEEEVALPIMPLSEHVVNDYRTLRLSLKGHPMSFLRAHVSAERILSCADLKTCRDCTRVSVAGVVLVRQRPGSAQGVVFMTVEDETGVANSVIWPKVLERERKVVMGARLVVVHGKVQRHEDIIHVVAERLEDRSEWLSLLAEDGEALSATLANADEVHRPEPGSWRPSKEKDPLVIPLAHADHVKHAGGEDSRERGHPRWHSRRHPRTERIIPKSRDFH
jgi:error-prone DNA polymerase